MSPHEDGAGEEATFSGRLPGGVSGTTSTAQPGLSVAAAAAIQGILSIANARKERGPTTQQAAPSTQQHVYDEVASSSGSSGRSPGGLQHQNSQGIRSLSSSTLPRPANSLSPRVSFAVREAASSTQPSSSSDSRWDYGMASGPQPLRQSWPAAQPTGFQRQSSRLGGTPPPLEGGLGSLLPWASASRQQLAAVYAAGVSSGTWSQPDAPALAAVLAPNSNQLSAALGTAVPATSAFGQSSQLPAAAQSAAATAPAQWHHTSSNNSSSTVSHPAGLHSAQEHFDSKRTWPGMRMDQLLHEKTGISANGPGFAQRVNASGADQLSNTFTGISAEGSQFPKRTQSQRYMTAVASGNTSTLAFTAQALVNMDADKDTWERSRNHGRGNSHRRSRSEEQPVRRMHAALRSSIVAMNNNVTVNVTPRPLAQWHPQRRLLMGSHLETSPAGYVGQEGHCTLTRVDYYTPEQKSSMSRANTSSLVGRAGGLTLDPLPDHSRERAVRGRWASTYDTCYKSLPCSPVGAMSAHTAGTATWTLNGGGLTKAEHAAASSSVAGMRSGLVLEALEMPPKGWRSGKRQLVMTSETNNRAVLPPSVPFATGSNWDVEN